MASRLGLLGTGNWVEKLYFGSSSTLYKITAGVSALASDEYYKVVQITAGTTLNTYSSERKCFKLFATQSITVAGTITCSGGPIWSASAGSTGFTMPQHNAPYASLGGSGSGGAAGASNGGEGNPTTAYIDAAMWLGGSGGDGGLAGDGTVGPGGQTVGRLANVNAPSIYQSGLVFAPTIYGENDLDGLYLPRPVCGGGGGGGAGGSDTAGGGGCGGGVVYLAAPEIIIDGGTISADGQSAENDVGGVGGGGGGGGGGAVIIVCSKLTFTESGGSIHCNGGTGGTAAGGNGENGSDGRILLYSGDCFAVFSGILDSSIYKKAIVDANAVGDPNWTP